MNDDIVLSFFGGVVGDLTKSSMTIKNHRFHVGIDYGLWQGNKREFVERNKEIPFSPNTIDALILTHAHVDHSGGIPILYNNGMGAEEGKGKIFCTEQTMKIAPIMILDTAKISERDFIRKPKKHLTDSKTIFKIRRFKKNGVGNAKTIERLDLGWAIEPYSEKDAIKSLNLFNGGSRGYHYWFKVAKGVRAKFYNSGHVLGGAICVLEVGNELNGKKIIRIGFSGDLGRNNGIILPSPEIIKEPLDYWVTESTYGGISHPQRDGDFNVLRRLIEECYRREGKVFIPSFSLERSQEIILILSRMMFAREIPRMNIHLDSPMAESILKIFAESWRKKSFVNQHRFNFNPFISSENKFLKIVSDYEASEALTRKRGPHIVVAGSGMGDAGRIRSHYKKGIHQEKNIILLVGYMATGTLNRNIADGHRIVGIDNKDYRVGCLVHKFGSFSAHADREELLEYTEKIVSNSVGIKKIFISHGGEKNGYELKLALSEKLAQKFGGDWDRKIIIPRIQEKFILH